MRKTRIRPRLPERLAALQTIAYNMHWCWSPDSIELFERIDRDLWQSTSHNPILLLGRASQQRLNELAEDPAFLAHLDRVADTLREYTAEHAWFQQKHPKDADLCVGYFSMEFGLHECLPTYSGGLGVLAGDHLKSASELGVPLTGVGLLYQLGYFRQYLNPDGWQGERYPENDFYNMPVLPALTPEGQPAYVTVDYPNRVVTAKVWKVQVGRIPLILLDTNIPENPKEDADITDNLYGGDRETRIRQEIMLGIGGYRAMRALGKIPSVCHMNEGHAAFLAFERTRRLMERMDTNYHEARQICRSANVFTTHTPVPAGFDLFDESLVRKYFGETVKQVGLSFDEFFSLGVAPGEAKDRFNMAVFAMRHSSLINGVSELHGEVSRKMFHIVWKDFPPSEVPIGHVTNGIHTRTWVSRRLGSLLDRYLGPEWLHDPSQHEVWDRLYEIPDEELWRVHVEQRETLVHFARKRLVEQLRNRAAPDSEINEAQNALDPAALTIGFARRFATYKRANLLLRDPDRLRALLLDEERPIQFIFAGKAHPHDTAAKEFIKQVYRFSREPKIRQRFIFLEDYDMNIARHLVQGVDVWLNTPRRPLEASGTSGMKVAANGGLNLSVLDGWWCEGYGETVRQPGEDKPGWQIGGGKDYADTEEQDRIESAALFEIIETDLLSEFFGRRSGDKMPFRWIRRMKSSMRKLCPVFNTNRMVLDYTEQYYLPSTRRYRALAADGFARGREMNAWRKRIEAEFGGVFVNHVAPAPEEATVGDEIRVRAAVNLGSLTPEDVIVEVLHGQLDVQNHLRDINRTTLTLAGSEDGRSIYEGSFACTTSGEYAHTVRVLPRHEFVLAPNDLPMVVWEEGVRW